jgi:hypothetical protein
MELHRLQLLCISVGILLFASCTKDAQEDPADTKSTWVRDLAGDTGASMSDGTDGKEKRPFYIFLLRLKDQKQTWIRTAADSAQYLQTADWDLAFTGPYNSEVYVNNGSYTGNPGYGGPAASAIVKQDKPYAQVTEAPSDEIFSQSSIRKIGQAESENAAGWFTYNMTTHLVKAIKSRTYLIKTPSGKFAKLELINVYKGNPPVVTDLYWPAPYLTFRYFVQEDGSRNLNTQ